MKKRTVALLIVTAGVAGAATFGWMTIRRGFSARDNPSAMEAYLARTARKLSIPASERDVKNPFAPTLKFSVRRVPISRTIAPLAMAMMEPGKRR